MFRSLTTGIYDALKSVLGIVVLFFLVIGVAKWGKANPDDFSLVVSKIGAAATAIVVWICDGIVNLLDSS